MGTGNQDLLFTLGVIALTSTKGLQSYVALQRRHPDGDHWVELARFASRQDAEHALRVLAEGGHVPTDDLRVRRVNLPGS